MNCYIFKDGTVETGHGFSGLNAWHKYKDIMSKQYKTLTDIKDAVSDARHDAEREARRGSRFVRSRGACLNTINIHQGQCKPNPAAEDEQWKGTNKQLDALIAKVRGMDVDEIWISGGFDGADCPRYMNEGDYDPWVSSWDILVWKRNGDADDVFHYLSA